MPQPASASAVRSMPPHGGELVNLLADKAQAVELARRAAALPRHNLSQREQCDLELMTTGALSPLRGFMVEEDYRRVVDEMRLADGTVWPLPVTLAVAKGAEDDVPEGKDLALYATGEAPVAPGSGKLLAILHVSSRFTRDKRHEARETFRTDDEKHPGVAHLYAQPDVVLGGRVTALALPEHQDFVEHRATPAQLRQEFRERGWRRVVGFQTRNPVHRAHEYLLKCALEVCDGLLLHPLVGETKGDDVPADIRMRCYQVLLDGYFPKDRVRLAVLEASMRYAGPREAIFHAIMRKNHGCTHFIVGRDHAGVGNYYGTYDAQLIFDEFAPEEIGITPLFFEHSFWCKRIGGMATAKTTPGTAEERVFLSGTKVREMLTRGEMPPVEFTRPEVAKVLMEGYRRMEGAGR